MLSGRYGDFRFMGGKREPLCATGESFATTDPVLASQLFAARMASLSDGNKASTAVSKRHGVISRAVEHYLSLRRKSSRATAAWLDQTEGFLERAVTFFGTERHLRTI